MDGGSYEGLFVNRVKEGKGIHTTRTGVRIKSVFKDNKAEGQSRITDGKIIYVGRLWHGFKHGTGRLYNGETFAKSEFTYSGGFYRDKYNEYGVLKNGTAYAYEGFWKHGLKEGHGHEKIGEFIDYQGFFEKGLRHGKGKLRDLHNETYFKGEFNMGEVVEQEEIVIKK